ncbi:hypothetical protein LSTR_LSTR012958 [Laodelphax striatellus]|uniref:Uncharacterized protein n=1 Tax=Laodelphax striatellus TaxID=195883 RepID=A0A482XEB2_LAOST|nr:hypothetical protein LSTR_LSTR012958 [Laodelphax striatellus]
MGWITQTSCTLCVVVAVAAVAWGREVPTAAQSAAVAGAAAQGAPLRVGDDTPPHATRGAKRELGEVAYHHGGHHKHATSYQNVVLHSYHPKKVIYHKKHGHHHDAPPSYQPLPHHPIAPPHHHSPVPVYDEGITVDDESYPAY